jgi:hypothetical protein
VDRGTEDGMPMSLVIIYQPLILISSLIFLSPELDALFFLLGRVNSMKKLLKLWILLSTNLISQSRH